MRQEGVFTMGDMSSVNCEKDHTEKIPEQTWEMADNIFD